MKLLQMFNNQKIKRLISKEILILFTIIVILIFSWIVLFLRNYYFERKIKKLNTEILSIKKTIDDLPTDQIKTIYNSFKDGFMVSYKTQKDSFEIKKSDENSFLGDHLDSKILPIHEKGYFESYVDVNPFKDLRNKRRNSLLDYSFDDKPLIDDNNWEKSKKRNIYKQKSTKSSCICFDYVDYGKFRLLLNDSVYREKFYLNHSYTMGCNRSFFEKIILQGLNYPYDSKNDIIRVQLSKQQEDLEKKLLSYKIINNDETQNLLFRITIIICLLVYPLRIVFYILKWSIQNYKLKG